MKPPIRIAVVGLGRAGWDIHVKQLQEHAEFRITDVADPSPQRREEAREILGCAAHETLAQLLDRSKAEVVAAATPSASHERDAIRILRAGKHCIVEKPMAMHWKGARRMMGASQRAKRLLFVHQNYRFRDEHFHLREVLDRGLLGDVFEIRVCWLSYARRNDWQTLKKNGGGVLNNTCPHVIDSVLDLMGAPVVSLMSDLQHIKDAGDCEDHVHLCMKAKNGCMADITISTACALPSPKWMLLGRYGTLSSDGITSALRYYDPRKVPRLKVVDGPAPGRSYGNGEKLPWEEKTVPSKPSQRRGGFYDNVADVLLRGGSMIIRPEIAAEVVRISQWARTGRRVP